MLFQRIMEQVRVNKNKVAIKDTRRALTYSELWDEVYKKREAAIHRGINSNSKVLLKMENCCEWLSSFLAFAIIGAKVITVSPESKEEQIQYLRSTLKFSYEITSDNCQNFFYFKDDAEEKTDILFPNNGAEVVYHITSGSTGEVKICIRTSEQLVAEGEMYEDRLNITSQDVIVCPLPLYHSFAFGAVLISGLITGATIVLMERFTPRKYLQILKSEKASLSFIVPVMAELLVKVKCEEEYDLSFMHYIVVGTGIVSEKVFFEFQKKFGIVLSSNYGSSETGGVITRTDSKSYPSVGKAMKGVSIQLRADNGSISSNNEGQLWIKAPSVMKGYYGQEYVFESDNFFFTGDIARIDQYGNIYILGRLKNIVSIGGKKINPVYVENVIKLYPDVKDTVVLGKRKENNEEVLVALISGRENLNLIKINEYLKEKLERYMIPSVIKIVESIPKNSIGKVDCGEVLALF